MRFGGIIFYENYGKCEDRMMELKIITYNIRVQSKAKFALRAADVAEMIRTEAPDVVCFQEFADYMQCVLAPYLPSYTFVGGFRVVDRSGEGTVVAFKRDRFFLSDCRTNWLSATPHIPGSRYESDQSIYPRIYTAVTLIECDTYKTFRIYNTHFDHYGREARLLEAEQLLSDIAEDSAYVSYPVIMTGDLNSAPNVPSIDMIRRAGGLTDVTAGIKQSFTNDGEPYDSWQGDKIDYIFVSQGVNCSSCERVDGDEYGCCGSDHYALSATLSI